MPRSLFLSLTFLWLALLSRSAPATPPSTPLPDPCDEPPIVELVPEFDEPPTIELDPGIDDRPKPMIENPLSVHRREANRERLTKLCGGTVSSQKAIEGGLEWLAAHQANDGGWSFNHRGDKCDEKCDRAGTVENARMYATALALLPYLGAGQTHKEGRYKDVVKAGLDFLLRNQKVVSETEIDLADRGAELTAHTLATLALCESYAMTQDKALLNPAQHAINHIVAAQDPVGGGWGLLPKQPGNTLVFGWQLEALKSAHMAYLKVDVGAIKGAMGYLDRVQSAEGAKYGLTKPDDATETSTAIGLNSRILLGWKRPRLAAGIKLLDERGPRCDDLRYTYWATYALREYSSDEWNRWNTQLRDPLVALQAKASAGHAAGSWHIAGNTDPWHIGGGRLYCTAMATLILQSYFRRPPILLGPPKNEDDFPL